MRKKWYEFLSSFLRNASTHHIQVKYLLHVKFLATGLYRHTKHTVSLKEVLGTTDMTHFVEHLSSMHEVTESNPHKVGMFITTYNPSTGEIKAGGLELGD